MLLSAFFNGEEWCPREEAYVIGVPDPTKLYDDTYTLCVIRDDYEPGDDHLREAPSTRS